MNKNHELDYTKIKDLRLENNLLAKDIAAILEIDYTTYSQYETMKVCIPITKLNNLANYYQVSLDYITNLNSNRTYPNIKKDINKEKIAINLKEFRTEKNLYQETLAREIGTSKSLICEYEKGKKLISLSYAYAICSRYNLSMDYLLGKIDNPKYIKNNKRKNNK